MLLYYDHFTSEYKNRIFSGAGIRFSSISNLKLILKGQVFGKKIFKTLKFCFKHSFPQN